MRRIAVYCGSATPADPIYIEAARSVGRGLAERGIGVVYGGGKLGLMGALADAALEAGGEVIGVIPDKAIEAEVAHDGLTALEVVRTLHERKARFTDLSDAFLTLPGGTGTMDELWEAMSWAQLGYHADPVGLLNIGGFYDALIAWVDHAAATGFIRPQHRSILIVGDTLDALLDRMASYRAPVPVFSLSREDL